MTARSLLFGLLVAAFLIWLVAILWKRRIYRDFPFFFAYLIWEASRTFVEDAVALSRPYYYFHTYWICEGIAVVLALLALYEAFRRVFLVFCKAWRGFEVIFPATVLVIVLLGSWNATLHPAIQADQVIVVLLAVGKVMRYLQAGVFALFFLLVWILGLDWEEYPFGIVLGFAISAVGAWLTYDVRSEYGMRFVGIAKSVAPVTYLFAVLVWLGAFRRVQAEQKQWVLGMTPEQMLTEARRYLAVLRGHS